MDSKKLKKQIINLLKKDSRIWDEKHDELNQIVLLDLIDKIDENIISLLLEDENVRGKFFIKIKDVYVFKTNDFKFFINENKINNSYTQYKNRIGLSDGKHFLKDTNDIVLDFPYKDCILEGGMSSEDGMDKYYEWQEEKLKDKLDENGNKIKDGRKNVKEVDIPAHYAENQAKRKEVFFNQVLAKDEIDRLLDDKAFVNWKRYTINGEEKVGEIKRDKNGTIKENLIIKGNNLLALHSLKQQFTGKVKLIYIDPPYNTGNDSFKYNDNFNHSAWLTFMKNRLEVAKDLLSEDGSIYIQLDYNEVHYFKVLMDEVFGYKNFQREIIWDISVLSGYKTMVNNWIRGHDSILFYTKKDKGFKFNKLMQPHTKEYEKMFNKVDENGRKYMVAHKKTRYWDVTKEKGKPFGDVWGDIMSFQQQPTSMERIEFDGQKPEKLLERIIRSSTDENDIVLDFFGGTGTTASVSMKIKRQFIIIEQMGYIDSKLLKRLEKTACGTHDTVLSKSVNWQGGGDFIYIELAKWNETAKETINKCANYAELINLFDELYEKYFLNYNVKIKEFKEKIIKEDNFIALDLEEQKKMFLTMLDLNQMYVQKSEMEDSQFEISKEDQELTNQFYKEI